MASTETSTDRIIAPRKLINLIKEVHLDKTKEAAIKEGTSERIKLAVDNDHLHRGAFHLCRRLYKMDELKRSDFIRSMMLYVDICNEGGLFGEVHAGDLADQAEEAERAERTAKPRRGRPPKAANGDAEPLSEAAQKVAKGIKQLKPKPAKKGMDGADAAGGTRIQ